MKQKQLANSRGWQMSTNELKLAMGLEPGRDWPPKGMTGRVQGSVVVVLPKNVHRRRHRAFVECAICARMIPAGRIYQHYTVHGEAE
jgi:hypothetical protein